MNTPGAAGPPALPCAANGNGRPSGRLNVCDTTPLLLFSHRRHGDAKARENRAYGFSISRTISRTALRRPMKIARLTMLWPMFSSVIPGIWAMRRTFT